MAQQEKEFEQGDTVEYALRTMNEPSLPSGPEIHHKGRLRLRDFASIVACLSDREIDELQAAIDERREARACRLGDADAATLEAEPPAS